jgi:hypothetical protein
MNSRRQTNDQVLGMISPIKAQQLLEDWANIDPGHLDDGAMRTLLRKYPKVFLDIDFQVLNERFPPPSAKPPKEVKNRQNMAVSLVSLITTVAVFLREGWSVSDPRRRDWNFIRARLAYHVGLEKLRDTIEELSVGGRDERDTKGGPVQPKTSATIGLQPREGIQFGFLIGLLTLPEVPLSTFEAAMFYLQTQLIDKLRICPNPTCATPYFFGMKRGQKFCSTICAAPAQREAKRKWWNENRGRKSDSFRPR